MTWVELKGLKFGVFLAICSLAVVFLVSTAFGPN